MKTPALSVWTWTLDAFSSSCRPCSETPCTSAPPGGAELCWEQPSWEDLRSWCSANKPCRPRRNDRPVKSEPLPQASLLPSAGLCPGIEPVLLCRTNPPGAGKHKGSSGRAASGQSFNKLIKYLLPLVGKRIAVLLLLAVLRTALSNRLARVQVLSWAFLCLPWPPEPCM